jgi:MYXO-CTERM domain-containing protein
MPMRPTARPLATAAALALLAVVGGGVGAPGTANAASYRYWSFWVGAGDGWSYAQVGAGSTRPADGSVQGWRFAISAGASSSTIPPRAAASFDAICGSDPAAEGRKRVGLVVDFGTTGDAPAGETPPRGIARVCVEAPASATGAAVLAQAFAVRSKDGLVCGIDGYPRTECAAIVRDAAPGPSSRPTPTPTRSTAEAPGGSTSSDDDASDARAAASAARPTPSGGGSAAGARPATTPAPDAGSGATSPATGDDAIDTAGGVDDPVLVTQAAASESGSPWGAVAAIVLVVAAGIGAWRLRRRSA